MCMLYLGNLWAKKTQPTPFPWKFPMALQAVGLSVMAIAEADGHCPCYLLLCTTHLVGGFKHEWIISHFTYGMSSFPLTNSYFSGWLKPPTSSQLTLDNEPNYCNSFPAGCGATSPLRTAWKKTSRMTKRVIRQWPQKRRNLERWTVLLFKNIYIYYSIT